MGRMALRPALRAYAHAPAGAEEYSPADIPGLLFWIDPSDASTITTTDGSTTHNPGVAGEVITSISDKVASKAFPDNGADSIYNPYTDATTGLLGNGLPFFNTADGAYLAALFRFTPGGGDDAVYSDLATGGVNSEWTTFLVGYAETNHAVFNYRGFLRGQGGTAPNTLVEASTHYGWDRWAIDTPWGDSATYDNWLTSDTPPLVVSTGRTQVIFLQSTYNGSAWEYRISQDAVNWKTTVHGRVPGSPAAADNKWSIRTRNWSPATDTGLGEMGFINGTVSDATLQDLHTYLKTKWDLYT